MTAKRQRTFRLILAVFAVFWTTLAVLGGCAGGTRGTSGETFSGSILTRLGQPVPGVTVTVIQTGDQSVTDAAGNFTIETNVDGQQAELLFERSDIMSRLTLDSIPAGKVTITLDLELDDTKEIKVKNRRDQEEDDHGSSSSSSSSSSGSSSSSIDDDNHSSSSSSSSSVDDHEDSSSSSTSSSSSDDGNESGNLSDDGVSGKSFGYSPSTAEIGF